MRAAAARSMRSATQRGARATECALLPDPRHGRPGCCDERRKRARRRRSRRDSSSCSTNVTPPSGCASAVRQLVDCRLISACRNRSFSALRRRSISRKDQDAYAGKTSAFGRRRSTAAVAKAPSETPNRDRHGRSIAKRAEPRRSRYEATQGRAAAALSRDAADPPLRGEGRPALRHGPDRRLLPPLYRPGSRRGRHADGDRTASDQVITGYRDHGHMLACRHGSQGRHGRADRPARRLFATARAARCTCSRREAVLRRPRHRRRAGVARHRPRLRQQLSRERRRLARPISATARPTRARSTRASTWRSCGSCRSST